MPFYLVVNARRFVPPGFVPLALVALVGMAQPARLVSQDEHKGKIDDVQHSADNAKKHGDHDGDGGSADDNDGSFGVFGGVRGFWHMLFAVPRDTGQGYLAYPYARADGSSSFVLRDVYRDRWFGAVSVSYFQDIESTLRAGQVSVEWTGGMFDRTIEFSRYAEPLADHTDHLSMLHAGVAVLPPIGDLGYLKVGLAFQGVFTDQGDAAGGPELVLGAQLFPKRPFGVAATARLAPLTWVGGPAFGTGFVDLMGGGSVFLGRVELQAGYRWTRVGVGAPFSGPTLGLRAWF